MKIVEVSVACANGFSRLVLEERVEIGPPGELQRGKKVHVSESGPWRRSEEKEIV